MQKEFFLKKEYCLKYKDEIVFKFTLYNEKLQMINKSLLPFSLNSTAQNYELVKKFCADRILMFNRKYCKELLAACGIEEENDILICIVCRGLSFRDHYWIDSTRSTQTWEEVNPYQNESSADLSETAITGAGSQVDINSRKQGKILTGELTLKGTRAKCCVRKNKNLYLYKAETMEEINSEILSYEIASALKLNAAQYRKEELFGKFCSVCQLFTSLEIELLPCREILSGYHSKMEYTGLYYEALMKMDPVNFIKMQIFDYVTLNADRNRDNFGLRKNNGRIEGLFPVFDHDSCFKGRSTAGIYFPTNLSFEETLKMLKTKYGNYYIMLRNDFQEFQEVLKSEQFKKVFLQYKSLEEYECMVIRSEDL